MTMVILQIGIVLDAVSALVLVVFAGLYAVSWVFGTGWWEGFWIRVSRLFDPFWERHWLLPAVVVAMGLTVYDAVAAELNAGWVTLLLWFVLTGYASWLFIKRRLFTRLHRRSLRKTNRDSNRDDTDDESDTEIPSSGRL